MIKNHNNMVTNILLSTSTVLCWKDASILSTLACSAPDALFYCVSSPGMRRFLHAVAVTGTASAAVVRFPEELVAVMPPGIALAYVLF
jgi:hypothetical protein